MKKLLLILSIVLFSASIFAQQYELDNSYIIGTGFNGEVNTMELDSDGKLLVGGNFTDYNGTTVTYLVRLKTDGTIDGTFSPTLTALVEDLTVHDNNAVTVVSAGALKRFDSVGAEIGTGTFDPAPANSYIISVDAEATGYKVVIGGAFTDIGGKIARLNEDGTVDATFATNIGTGYNGTVRAVEIGSSGKIVVGGEFTSFNSTTRNKISVLNSEGTLDTGFDPSQATNPFTVNVYSVAFQGDGKVLVGTYNGYGYPRLSQLNTDGTEDFYGGLGLLGSYVTDIHADATTIVCGGWFAEGVMTINSVTGTPQNIVTGNGIEGASEEVNAIAVQVDGAIILGGSFTTYNGIAVNNFVRIAPCAVSIDSQPEDATICDNQDTSFTVTASGTGTLLYQWQENTNGGDGLYTDISNAGVFTGATTSTLTITAAPSSMDEYYYRCIVTDDNCSSTSRVAILQVNPPQTITVLPENATGCENGSASFSIEYTGTPGGWQWQEDPGTGVFSDITSGNYSGNTHSTLTVNNLSPEMDGYKYRLISDLCNLTLITDGATLTVTSLPVITSVREDQSVCETGDAVFSVSATADRTLSYQWQYRSSGGAYVDLAEGVVYSGTETANLNITGADNTLAELYDSDNSDGLTYATYRCIVANNACELISDASILWIYDSPTITTQPENVDECDNGSGVNTSFSILPSETSGMTYQWQVDDGTGFIDVIDDEVYSGSNVRTLSLTDATSALNENLYRCIVGNCSTPVISDNALLSITEKPIITNANTGTTTICEGSDTTFSFDASGIANSYQWEEYTNSNWSTITDNATFSGANSNSLDISDAPLSYNNVSFRCVVTNGTCSVNTSNFRLSVRSAPTISTLSDYYKNRSVCEDGSISLNMNVSNFISTIHTYQWQEEVSPDVLPGVFGDITDDAIYNNSQTKTLSINGALPVMDGKRYILKILGCVNEVVSDTVLLTVNDSTRITSQPITAITLCESEDTVIGITATGDNLTYNWQSIGGGGIGNRTSDTMKLTNIPASIDGSIYYCVVNGTCGTGVTSEQTLLTVRPNTYISNANLSVVVCLDSDTAFTAEAIGHNLSYTWNESGTSLSDNSTYSGTNTERLQITGVTVDMQSKYYECTVNGTCGISVSRNMGYISIPGILTKPDIYEDASVSGTVRLYTGYSGTHYWYKDGILYDTNSGELVLTENGVYTVTIEDGSYGCVSPLSDSYTYSTVGISESLVNKNITIYPNPTNGILNIESTNLSLKEIQVLDITGKLIFTSKSDGVYQYSINVEDLPKGMYILKIHTEKGFGNKRFIID